MYAYIKGTLEEILEDRIVLENNGIGYNILFSAGKFPLLPPIGSEMRIYTYTAVREDAFLLFGFQTKEELDLFKKLIGVSGIGPKGGLAILSTLSVSEIIAAIVTGDAKKIAKSPGIGAKTAERVIIDLKDKVSLESAILDFREKEVAEEEFGEEAKEAVEALTALGYGAKEAKTAVQKAGMEGLHTSSGLLKAALKYL